MQLSGLVTVLYTICMCDVTCRLNRINQQLLALQVCESNMVKLGPLKSSSTIAMLSWSLVVFWKIRAILTLNSF